MVLLTVVKTNGEKCEITTRLVDQRTGIADCLSNDDGEREFVTIIVGLYFILGVKSNWETDRIRTNWLNRKLIGRIRGAALAPT